MRTKEEIEEKLFRQRENLKEDFPEEVLNRIKRQIAMLEWVLE